MNRAFCLPIGAAISLSSAILLPGAAASRPIQEASPANSGLPATFTAALDSVLLEAVKRGATAGVEGMVLVGEDIVYHGVAGYLQKTPTEIPMVRNALFDVASLTKVVATTTSLMMLLDEGKISLDDPISSRLSEFRRPEQKSITVRHLLTHTSGIPNLSGFHKKRRGKVLYLRGIAELPLSYPPGMKRVYSDTGMMVAGWIVEREAGVRLDRFARERIFEPLGMEETFFNPHYSERDRIASTELCRWREEVVRGFVHDENAYALGGVSGHAGLFSTARDLAIFCRMILRGGERNGVRLLSEETVQMMLEPQPIPDYEFQALGWRIQEERGQDTGSLISPRTFGHTGFTGTSLWMDPDHDLAVILLSNAIHPRREDADRTFLRKAFHEAVARTFE